MLGDLPVLVKAEDVKGHLLPRSGEVVDGLEEHIVPVLKGPDVVHRGLDRGGGQVLHRAQEGGLPGAVGQVVLDVVLVQQAGGGLGVAGGEGADEGGGFFNVGHGRFLLVGVGVGIGLGLLRLWNGQLLPHINQVRVPDGILVGLIDSVPLTSAAQLLLGDLPQGVAPLHGVRSRSGRKSHGQRQGGGQGDRAGFLCVFFHAVMLLFVMSRRGSPALVTAS